MPGHGSLPALLAGLIVALAASGGRAAPAPDPSDSAWTLAGALEVRVKGDRPTRKTAQTRTLSLGLTGMDRFLLENDHTSDPFAIRGQHRTCSGGKLRFTADTSSPAEDLAEVIAAWLEAQGEVPEAFEFDSASVKVKGRIKGECLRLRADARFRGRALVGSEWIRFKVRIEFAGSGEREPLPVVDDGDELLSAKAMAVRSIRVAPGWETPRLVPGGVNSVGWEDSASISPDGGTLFFCYVPCDFQGFSTTGCGDLDRFAEFRCGPDRGNVLDFAFDTLCSTLDGDTFSEPRTCSVSVDTTPSYQSETGLMLAGDSLFYVANYPTLPDDCDPDIYRDGVRLSFNTDAEEHDPCFADGELFFWSHDRPGGLAPGKKNLWMTREVEGDWSTPVLVAGPVNRADSDSWQCHLTPGGLLYFSSDRDGTLSIYASPRLGENEWAEPTRVVWPNPGGCVVAVAEPSLTADESVLYFCVLFRNADGSHDLDIAFTRRID